MVGLEVIKSPLREWEGAASCPADLAPELAEGRGRTGASGGRGWGMGCRYAHGAKRKRTQRAPYFARYEQKGGSGADAERRGTIIIL